MASNSGPNAARTTRIRISRFDYGVCAITDGITTGAAEAFLKTNSAIIATPSPTPLPMVFFSELAPASHIKKMPGECF